MVVTAPASCWPCKRLSWLGAALGNPSGTANASEARRAASDAPVCPRVAMATLGGGLPPGRSRARERREHLARELEKARVAAEEKAAREAEEEARRVAAEQARLAEEAAAAARLEVEERELAEHERQRRRRLLVRLQAYVRRHQAVVRWASWSERARRGILRLQTAVRRQRVEVPMRQLLADAHLMREGEVFCKFNNAGRPKDRLVWLSDDLRQLRWEKPSQKSNCKAHHRIAMSEVVKVDDQLKFGLIKKILESLRSFDAKDSGITSLKPKNCFCVTTTSRTLDLQATSKQTKIMWAAALRLMLAFRRLGPLCDIEVRRSLAELVEERNMMQELVEKRKPGGFLASMKSMKKDMKNISFSRSRKNLIADRSRKGSVETGSRKGSLEGVAEEGAMLTGPTIPPLKLTPSNLKRTPSKLTPKRPHPGRLG